MDVKKLSDEELLALYKKSKTTADVLKVTANGTFGKLGSKYSILYAPELLLAVTITGQLALLMLIEAVTKAGIRVISANTDGIECQLLKAKHEKKLHKIVKEWEERTGMVMEFGEYRGLYSRDVNSYVAAYDGYTKAKGFYAPSPDLRKNPEYPVVQEAIRQYLLDGTPMEETIRAETNPAKFCVIRTVRGGALWTDRELPSYPDEKRPGTKAAEKRDWDYKKQFYNPETDFVGKAVRYYYSTKGAPMVYVESKNRVPKTADFNGVKPMMELPDKLPSDLDYDAYFALAKRHLEELGVEK